MALLARVRFSGVSLPAPHGRWRHRRLRLRQRTTLADRGWRRRVPGRGRTGQHPVRYRAANDGWHPPVERPVPARPGGRYQAGAGPGAGANRPELARTHPEPDGARHRAWRVRDRRPQLRPAERGLHAAEPVPDGSILLDRRRRGGDRHQPPAGVRHHLSVHPPSPRLALADARPDRSFRKGRRRSRQRRLVRRRRLHRQRRHRW
jgi:hypothetical protein